MASLANGFSSTGSLREQKGMRFAGKIFPKARCCPANYQRKPPIIPALKVCLAAYEKCLKNPKLFYYNLRKPAKPN
jgi:hypothetical protein